MPRYIRNNEKPAKVGSNISLSLCGEHTDTDKLTSYFKKLSDGGNVGMPLEKQMWGDTFGMCTDKYGIHWMVNIGQAEAAYR